MAHDSTKVLFGSTGSSDQNITMHAGDASVFKAGLVVCLKSDGTLSLDHSEGEPIGVSLGRSLSDYNKISVLRCGNLVPMRVTAELASLVKADMTFTSKLLSTLGNDISIAFLDTNTGNNASVTVVGTAISVSIDSGTTHATTIKNAIEANAAANALISVVIADGEGSTAQTAFALDNLEGGGSAGFLAIGSYASVSDVTGEIIDPEADDAVVINAVILSDEKWGIDPITKEEYPCCLVDLGGGV